MALLKRGGLRLVDSFAFVASARQTIQIQVPARYMQRIWLWLRGTLTISAVTIPGTVHTDGPANLLATVELLVDGRTTTIGAYPPFLPAAQRQFYPPGPNAGV